jgi:uncharacterized protein YecT (DUF1311 family)
MILIAALALAASVEEPYCKQPRWQSEMNACTYIEYEKADAAMNAAWKPLAAIMKDRDKDSEKDGDAGPGYFAALFKSQQAWLKFRDAHCETLGNFAYAGSMQPTVYNMCLEELTKARTKQLQELLEMYQL